MKAFKTFNCHKVPNCTTDSITHCPNILDCVRRLYLFLERLLSEHKCQLFQLVRTHLT